MCNNVVRRLRDKVNDNNLNDLINDQLSNVAHNLKEKKDLKYKLEVAFPSEIKHL